LKSKLFFPLFIITSLYFVLGFVNIVFAFLALVCMFLPFILAYRDKKKTWCRRYCPRAGFLTILGSKGIRLKSPKWLTSKNIRHGIIYYFAGNLFFIIMSTIMVSIGRIPPIDKVRFLIFFQIPWDLPQLLSIIELPAIIIHLSFRLYSLMLTSTVLGVFLAVIYQPRTWCAVCPINTLTGAVIKK
jgi:hypothetical protein